MIAASASELPQRVVKELMAIAPPNTANGTSTTTTAPSTQSYTAPLATVTTLFFMWGFLTCLNDILVPHLKSIFDLSYAGIMLIQFAFFGAYFLFSIPSAKIIDWIGYQRSMVVGLLTMGVGAFLFVPAASAPSYPLFLAALVVLAAGITCLQVAANPYVTVLGKPSTASSRLNLTQAFNSLGTFLVKYFSQPEIGGLTEKVAASFVAFYWGGAMVGRFIGSGLLQKMKTGQLLGICAVCAAALVAISMLSTGHFAMWSIILVGFFNSIMFPSIFTLGVAELGPLTGDGSGIMIMAIVGGALIPLLQGAIADKIGIHHAFFLPVICYLYILYFALSGSKPNSERYART